MSGTIVRGTTEAEDIYLWLEQTYDPKALAWAAEHTVAAKNSLGNLGLYPQLLTELRSALQLSESAPRFTFIGNKLTRFRTTPEHPHGILELAERDGRGIPIGWRTVLDVDAFGAERGKTYALGTMRFPKLGLPPDYGRCLMPLAPGGGDETEWHEFDLEAGAFVDGGFHTAASYTEAVWLTRDRLLIAHTLGDAPLSGNRRGPAQAYLWDRGTPIEAARPVLRLDPSDALMFMDAIGTGASRRAVITRVHDYATYSFAIIDLDGRVSDALLPRKIKGLPYLTVTGRHFFVQLAEEAKIGRESRPPESVIAYDVHPDTPDAERASFVYACGDDEFINDITASFAGTLSDFYFITDKRTRHRLRSAQFSNGRWNIEEIRTAPPGVTLKFGIWGAAGDVAGKEYWIEQTGLLTPARFELVTPNNPPVTIHQDTPLIDAEAFEVEMRTARSRDGTEIDYYLLRPRTIANPGATPTLMTGYGAFGLSCKPGYFDDMWLGGQSLKLWLDRGGAVVVPIIRGGGERGEAWHNAALKEKRQNSYDDFIAAARDLIDCGFTKPANLGVFGSSNGGLLSGTVSVQRPELFGAAVIDAPVLDQLRYHKMGIGAGLINEYGDPEDPIMRQAILGYSPYQNLRPGRTYPPFLVTVATTDDRVDPGHARKFVARAQEIGANVLFIEEQEGGHGVSDSVTNPELMAIRMAFFINTLM